MKRLEVLALDLPPNGTLGFVEDPDTRIRRIDRALREQLELKSAFATSLRNVRVRRRD